jgi:hypothetical protein
MDANELRHDGPEDASAQKRIKQTVLLGSAAGGLIGALVAVSLVPLDVLRQAPRPTPKTPDVDFLSSRGGGGVAGPTPEARATPAVQSLYAEIESFTLTMTHSTLAAIPGATAGAIVGGISTWLGNIFSSRKKRKNARRKRW